MWEPTDEQRNETVSWILDGHFSCRHQRRFIEGLAISSDRENAHGVAYIARGLMNQKLPIPLLVNHDWLMPLGRVIRASAVADRVVFTAELCNDDAHYWTAQVWPMLVAQVETGISMHAICASPPVDRKYKSWCMKEISVVANPADAGACIQKVYERLPYVSLDRPRETVHWSVAR